MTRSDINELADELAKEVAPGNDSFSIHLNSLMLEFSRKLAEKICTEFEGHVIG